MPGTAEVCDEGASAPRDVPGECWGCYFHEPREAPMDEYDGRQFVGIDLHRQRSVIVRQSESGEQLSAVRIVNDPVALKLQLEEAGADPEVVLEATYGWYWAVDVLQACGARVHLAHPLGVKGFRYRRVKNDVRDAADLADLLRISRTISASQSTQASHSTEPLDVEILTDEPDGTELVERMVGSPLH